MNEHKGQFVLVSIAHPTSNDAEGWVKQNPYSWTFGQGYSQSPDGKVPPDPSELYKVEGVPMTVFIDRKGNVADTVVGGMEKADFEEHLAKIL